jgi:hypothetical protein
VITALAFDFMNGFHDAANSIATVVSTGVLKPHHAVAFASFFNFVALFVFQLKVAATVGKGIVDPAIVDHYVIFGALMGALSWTIVTWYYGIPSSSSHALIGGLIGAVVAKVGIGGLITSGISKTLIFIIVSPTLGFLLGGLLMLGVSWIFFRTPPSKVDRWFRRLQLVSAGYYSLGHGANDAEDDRDHLVADDFRRSPGHRCQPAARLRLSPAMRPWAWAPCSAAGASSRPWAAADQACRSEDSAPRRAGRLPDHRLAGWLRSTPTPSLRHCRRRLLAQARPCAGVWPATSSGPGCSPFSAGLHVRCRLVYRPAYL